MTPGLLRVTLAGILLVGLGLRLSGLAYGLPNVYNPDEVAIMNRALAFATGDLNPHNFLYPTLYFYVLFVWEGLFFLAGRIGGFFTSVADFERTFFVDPSAIYLAGRALSALAGTATIWAAYRFGTRLYTRSIGLIAAGLLAVAPIAVRDGHYVKHDVPVTLVILTAHVVFARLALDAAWRERPISWLLAGALAGLATSTHYYAIFLVVPLAALAIVAPPTIGRVRAVAVAAAAMIVAFVAGSPFLLAEPATAVRDMIANRQIVMDRAMAPSGAFASLTRYAALLATDALGWPVFAAGIAGFVVALATKPRRAALLIGFPVVFLLFISNTVPASRYLNPVLPFFTVAAAIAIVRIGRLLSPGAIPVVAVLAAIPGLLASLHAGWFFRQPDTRTLARHHIEREVPAGSSVLVQPYSVSLRQSRDGLVEALRAHLGDERRASTKFQRLLALDPYPAPAYRTIYLGDGGLDADKIYVSPAALAGPDPLAPLRSLGIDFVILKRFAGDESLAPLLGALAREGRLRARFAPWAETALSTPTLEPFLHNTDARIDDRLDRPGPVIEIWQLNR